MNPKFDAHAAWESLKPRFAELEAHFSKENEKFLAMMSTDHDALGRVLKAHLAIENFMERFLVQHFGSTEIETARLTFFQKASLLPSNPATAWLRGGILQLNSLRNKFAHRVSHNISKAEMNEIYAVLNISQKGKSYVKHVDAIEDFTRIVCAFLMPTPVHIRAHFDAAFAKGFNSNKD